MRPDRVLTAAELGATAAAIAALQSGSGAIPWVPEGKLDPWNHVEATLALDVGGRHEGAAAALRWLALTQRRDGAWFAGYTGEKVTDRTLDANFVTYVAVGVWHHYLMTGDRAFAERLWPTVEAAIDFALELQRPDGTICWARDANYRVWDGALLTSCSSIYLSLRCAIGLAERLGTDRIDWELSAHQLQQAVRKPELFEDKDRFAMDWYYPVLAGAVAGPEAVARIEARWEEFVIEGRGARCVSDRPWVTTGETAELVLALVAAGMNDQAVALLGWIQHLRADDGLYWMGATHPDSTIWPRQRPTWGAAAIVLAHDVLHRDGAARGIFSGAALPSVAATSDLRLDPL